MMNNSPTHDRASVRVARIVLAVACGFSAACVGIKTSGERDSRDQVQKVLRKYRPEGAVLELPRLRSGGSPETFVRYAIYKHPQVEAAYYEWLASVEKITRERSLPNPRLTFQADITQMILAACRG